MYDIFFAENVKRIYTIIFNLLNIKYQRMQIRKKLDSYAFIYYILVEKLLYLKIRI